MFLFLVFFLLCVGVGFFVYFWQSSSVPLLSDVSGNFTVGVYPEPFFVQGNKIVDGGGNQRVFRGMAPVDPVIQYYASSSDPRYEDPSYLPWGPESYQKMASLGTKIVRIGIHPISIKEHGLNDTFRILDQAIEWSAQNGMYVILDYHSIGFPPDDVYFAKKYDTSDAEILEFWTQAAQRYRDNYTVAFYELFNEPVKGHGGEPAEEENWIAWRDYVQNLLGEIREVDPSKPVIVSGLDWGYDLYWALEYPVEGNGVVYGTHPYPSKWRWGRNWTDAFGAVSEKYPVFATEFSYDFDDYPEHEYDGPGRYREAIISYFEERNISWTVWCFDSTWTPSLLADTNYTLTDAGQYFTSVLMEKNALK